MNKSLLASALGIGGTGASLTGAYSLGFFEGWESRPSFTGGNYYNWKVINALSSFKEISSPDCIQKTFPGITPIDKANGYRTFNSETSDKDLKLSFSQEKDSNGCLVVDWTRQESNSSSKYTGDFTLLWSFVQENQGFITYANFKFNKHGRAKVVADGLVYALSKESGSSKPWKITSQYEVWGKEIDNDGDKLPKPGQALKGLKNKNLWGLEGENTNTSDLVKESDLVNDKTKFGGSYWKWLGSKGGNEKVSGFSSNLEGWWKELFKDCKNNIPDVIKDISGSWEEILIVTEEKAWTETGRTAQ